MGVGVGGAIDLSLHGHVSLPHCQKRTWDGYRLVSPSLENRICHTFPPFYLFFKDFIYLFSQTGEAGEKEGEKHQLVASPTSPAGDLVCNPGMFPAWESNW